MVEKTVIENIADELASTQTQPTNLSNEETVLTSIADDLGKSEEVTKEIVVEENKEEKTEDTKEEVKEDFLELADEEEKLETPDKNIETLNESLKEIGIEPIKSVSELKEYISSLKNENEISKQKASEIYANDEIRALNDYVKQGGDLKAYTDDLQNISKYEQTVKYLDTITPADAYKQSIVLQYGVTDFAQLPEEKQQQIADYLEFKNPIEIEIEGRKLINSEKTAYQQEIDKLKNGIEKSKEILQKKNEAYASNVSKSIQSLAGVDGIKVSETEKQELATILKDPKKALSQIMPLDENGLPNVDALVKIIYRAKYGERNAKYLRDKAKSSGKKEVFEKITNSAPKELTAHSKSVTTNDPLAEAVSQMN